ncbi:MAG TPA: Flp pilus assembly protein CpaB [Burkholderiales bacterium]|nr:Flp pilus assembly protein CpaB [Burkholderiales bacterium]
MRNPKAVAMLVLSVLIGLGATVLAAGWISQQGRMASTKVVVAAGDIQLGSRLTPQMLKTVDWPSGSIPPGVIADAEKLEDRVVKTSLLRGEPILEAKLAPIGTKGGLSAVIPEGKRAMTVRVNDVIGVAGFALPGNYVDIVVNTQLEGSGRGDRQISKIVLEHILVLAVAQESSRDETKPRVVNAVTLELTPEEAEKLDLARSVGTLSLVLRNQVDKEGVETRGIMKPQLLAGDNVQAEPEKKEVKPARPARAVTVKKKPAVVTVAASTETVEVIKGVQKSNVEF